MGQNRVIAQHQLPFSFNIEDQYSQWQTRPLWKTQSSLQIEIPAVDLQDPPQGRHDCEGNPSTSSHLVPPQQLQNAGANSINAEVYPPRGRVGDQVDLGTRLRSALDDSGYYDSTIGAPNDKGPERVFVIPPTNSDREGGSRGGIVPRSKASASKPGLRIPPYSPSGTTTSWFGAMFRKLASAFTSHARGSGNRSLSNTSTVNALKGQGGILVSDKVKAPTIK